MLKDIFVSTVRVKLLKILLPQSDSEFHVRALVRSVGTEINAVRRELTRLQKIGLLKRRPSGNKVYYKVNTHSVYYPELLSLVSKEMGLGKAIIENAKSLGDIKYAVLSKAYSRGRQSSMLDIDLLIIGDVNLTVLEKIIKDEESKTGREVHYTVLSEEEFLYRKRKNDNFITSVLSQSRTMLLGDEEAFCKLS
ncbi:MAG: ArsR family transcriptional regulator [Patescibacteria group bacterium]